MGDTYAQFQHSDRGRFGDNERSGEVEKISGTKQRLHDLDVTVIERRERSVKVRVHSSARYFWFPISQVELSPKEDGRFHTLSAPEWLLNERGIL